MVKFRILPKVDGLRKGNVQYKPGDIVDLPSSYDGESWLERVDPLPVVAAVPGKIEPLNSVEPVAVPLETPISRKKTRKRPRIFRR
jgi:hypothetical protein